MTLDLGLSASGLEAISTTAVTLWFSTTILCTLSSIPGQLSMVTRIRSTPTLARAEATATFTFFGKPTMASLAVPSKIRSCRYSGSSRPSRWGAPFKLAGAL